MHCGLPTKSGTDPKYQDVSDGLPEEEKSPILCTIHSNKSGNCLSNNRSAAVVPSCLCIPKLWMTESVFSLFKGIDLWLWFILAKAPFLPSTADEVL